MNTLQMIRFMLLVVFAFGVKELWTAKQYHKEDRKRWAICTCKIKVDTHKKCGCLLFSYLIKLKWEVKTWEEKECPIENGVKKKK